MEAAVYVWRYALLEVDARKEAQELTALRYVCGVYRWFRVWESVHGMAQQSPSCLWWPRVTSCHSAPHHLSCCSETRRGSSWQVFHIASLSRSCRGRGQLAWLSSAYSARKSRLPMLCIMLSYLIVSWLWCWIVSTSSWLHQHWLNLTLRYIGF